LEIGDLSIDAGNCVANSPGFCVTLAAVAIIGRRASFGKTLRLLLGVRRRHFLGGLA
jgi:hypothetical protein